MVEAESAFSDTEFFCDRLKPCPYRRL